MARKKKEQPKETLGDFLRARRESGDSSQSVGDFLRARRNPTAPSTEETPAEEAPAEQEV